MKKKNTVHQAALRPLVLSGGELLPGPSDTLRLHPLPAPELQAHVILAEACEAQSS